MKLEEGNDRCQFAGVSHCKIAGSLCKAELCLLLRFRAVFYACPCLLEISADPRARSIR